MPGLGGEVLIDLSIPKHDFSQRVAQAWLDIPADRDERIKWRVNAFSMLAGSLAPFDQGGFSRLATLEFDRTGNFLAVTNHMRAMEASEPKDRRPFLGKVAVPALIIHGTEDPIFPFDHATATAQAVRTSELLPIEKMGHELPRVVWPMAIDAILAHTRRAEELQHRKAST